ncbi:LysR family transcriptional regulator [Chelatococcus asaccharovorans]|uniref:LysR family transcriptional regulator n=1 Tax=Chelatococcus asaccharovorans TaxID=28210 RepID=UPI00224C6C74|nr:LysR family transcriptional regulator [Chelatococcus asaccharovorans]CAH1667297.1 LysR family cyn operon transcriptional activator [Chelatococcus asaccharovorans]CAH1681033.1 LysR family cyn operon transcriptional activator [Chelatococcus asaccharovorans]
MARTALSNATFASMRRLSVRQLIYFRELHRSGSFSKAASALSISQPTLSQQLAQLEDSLGAVLIERKGRLLRLTPHGKLLLERSKKVLDLLSATIEEFAELSTGQGLRIGMPSYLSYPVISLLLGEFRAAHPDISPFMIEATAEEMSRMLNEGELDAGFMSLPTPALLSEAMDSLIIWKADYRLCMSKAHPVARRLVLTGQDIAKLDIVLAPPDYHRTHYDYQLRGLRSLGIEPRIVHAEVLTTQSHMQLASAGLGACLISEGTVPIPDDLVLKHTDPSIGSHRLALFWRVDSSNPHLRTFLSAARQLRQS